MKKIKLGKNLVLTLGFVLVASFVEAADLGTHIIEEDTLSAVKLKQYQRVKKIAESYYDGFAYAKGINLYKRALKLRPTDDTLKLHIANGYFHSNNVDSSYYWYSEVITSKSLITDDAHYMNYAEVLTSMGRYEEARDWYKKYEKLRPNDSRAQKKLGGFDNVTSFYKDSVRYSIAPVSFNSESYDFSPCYFEDKIIFVSARETQGVAQVLKAKYAKDKSYFLNLFLLDSGDDVKIFNRRIHTSYHEGPASFFENDTKVIFTRNNFTKAELRIKSSKLHVNSAVTSESESGINKLKLFSSEKNEDGKWSVPVPLSFNSDEFSTGHPTVSKDNKRLYFSSDRPGGFGKTDLYISTWKNGVWSDPKNLGSSVNTEGAELFSFVDENEMLYFSSDGRDGLGGLDVFKMDLKNPQGSPVNLGFPINTRADDFGIILKNTGTQKTGYFSSNRLGGKGLDDIYKLTYENNKTVIGKVVNLISGLPMSDITVFSKNEQGDTLSQVITGEKGMFNFSFEYGGEYSMLATKPGYRTDTLVFEPIDIPEGDTVILKLMKEVLLVRGKAIDDLSGAPLDSVRIFVTNHTTGEKFGMHSKADGIYSFIAKPQMEYTVLMKKYRFLSSSMDISTGNQRHGDIIFIGRLEEIVIGKPIELNEIHFDVAKWNIREDAAIELDHFVRQLNENPSIIVELDTHTDSRGSASYNLKLSDRRAKSSAEYVAKHGIAKERIVGKGYGESKLLNECADGVKCTEEQHQVNRRAEFKVTGFLPEKESDETKSWVWIDPDYISASMSESDKKNIMSVNDRNTGSVTLSGKVLDTSGLPLVKTLVSMIEQGTQKATQVYSNTKGNFSLTAKPDRIYNITFQKEGYHEEGIKVSVKKKNIDDISFQLAKKK
jgi:outer membrane protein OmpA-like peptidoglycan-associated protein/tetratricopeptide (TPR) repeat protein